MPPELIAAIVEALKRGYRVELSLNKDGTYRAAVVKRNILKPHP